MRGTETPSFGLVLGGMSVLEAISALEPGSLGRQVHFREVKYQWWACEDTGGEEGSGGQGKRVSWGELEGGALGGDTEAQAETEQALVLDASCPADPMLTG